MEIKEEGTSEEGQHFLPTVRANDPEDIQFTSKYMCLVSRRFPKSQTVTQIRVSQTNILARSQKPGFHQGAWDYPVVSTFLSVLWAVSA